LLFAKLDNISNKLAYSSTSVLTQTMGDNAPPLAGRRRFRFQLPLHSPRTSVRPRASFRLR
jgi:hypothetical protein